MEATKQATEHGHCYSKKRKSSEAANIVAHDAVSSIRTIASFCAEERILALYKVKCKSSLKFGIQQGIVNGFGIGIANLLTATCNFFGFLFGAHLVEHHITTYDKVFQVCYCMLVSAFGVCQSVGLAPDVPKVKAAVNSIFSILDRKSRIDPMDPAGVTLSEIKGVVEFRHVSFKYPTRPDIQVLRDLCLFVDAGKSVALVGESGSGKSTLVSILERFYDPNAGQVLIDDIDIKAFQLKWLREQIGLVGQEPILFRGTIKSNIAYGRDGLLTDEEIRAAAQASNANNFISSLPHAFDTQVGERGIQLSGGEKQRIAIARVLVKHPKILVLDEATSALDAESEHVVQEALLRAMVDRTTFVVAHRLSSIVNVDIIAVMKNGVIVESGSHKELMKVGGAYASLINLHAPSMPSTELKLS